MNLDQTHVIGHEDMANGDCAKLDGTSRGIDRDVTTTIASNTTDMDHSIGNLHLIRVSESLKYSH